MILCQIYHKPESTQYHSTIILWVSPKKQEDSTWHWSTVTQMCECVSIAIATVRKYFRSLVVNLLYHKTKNNSCYHIDFLSSDWYFINGEFKNMLDSRCLLSLKNWPRASACLQIYKSVAVLHCTVQCFVCLKPH